MNVEMIVHVAEEGGFGAEVPALRGCVTQGRDLCRLLEQNGWQRLSVRGSHHVYGKPGERATLSVPVHGNAPLPAARHLLKLAGIDPERN